MACARRILVVDDDPDIRDAISEILADRGYCPATARDGEDALHVLLELPEPPCVIFLDMMMPVMSGPEFLEEISHLEACVRAIPIIVVSAHVDSVEGVADVLKKPFSAEKLEQAAARFC